jgi:hypothetical protein
MEKLAKMPEGFYIWNGLKNKISFGYYDPERSQWEDLEPYHGTRRIRTIHDPGKWVSFRALKCLMVLVDEI